MATTKAKAASTSGISLNTGTRVESRLTFKPRVEDNFICKGFITKVELQMVDVAKIKDNGQENTSEYAGYTVPNLVIEFKQLGIAADPKPRYYAPRWNMPATRGKDGAPLDKKMINDIVTNNIKQIIHILQAFEGVPGYVLADMDIDLDPMSPIETRIEQYKTLFQFVVDTLVGGDPEQPIYKTVGLWIKLVTDYQRGTFLCFPNFVGQGFIERIQQGVKTSLSFAPKETIELKAAPKKGTAGHTEAVSGNTEIDPDLQKVMDQYNM